MAPHRQPPVSVSGMWNGAGSSHAWGDLLRTWFASILAPARRHFTRTSHKPRAFALPSHARPTVAAVHRRTATSSGRPVIAFLLLPQSAAGRWLAAAPLAPCAAPLHPPPPP